MSAVAIVVQTLLDAAPVTAIVGDRIHPGLAPQKTELPSVVVTLASEAEPPILSGRGEFREATVIVDCAAPSFAQADAITERSITALCSAVHATVGAWSATIQRGQLSVTDQGDDGRHHRRRQSFTVHWR